MKGKEPTADTVLMELRFDTSVKGNQGSHTQPKLILQVSKANPVICPFPEEISQPVLPPLEDLMWRKTRGKIIMTEMRKGFARLWTHKTKIIIFLSIVPFRVENCNANPVDINCSHAINSCAGVETKEVLDNVQSKSVIGRKEFAFEISASTNTGCLWFSSM